MPKKVQRLFRKEVHLFSKQMEVENNLKISIKNMKKYIVYQTTNLINSHIYIGIHGTENPDIFDGYLGNGIKINSPSSYMYPKTPMQYAVKKYGIKNFKRITLKVFDTLEEALQMEADIVNKDFIKRKDVYNVALGGNMGTHFIPYYQFDNKGKLLKKWESIVEASEFYNVTDGAICNAARFKGSCAGYFWSKENTININEYSFRTHETVYKYCAKTGKLLEEYWSCVEAAKENNTTKSLISRGCKGGYKVGDYYYTTTLYDIYIPKKRISLKNKIIYIYNLNGDFVKEFNSKEEICSFFNISTKSNDITTAIRTERQYKGYQIRLEKFNKINPVKLETCKAKKVDCFDLLGNLIEEFDSMTKAVQKYGTGVQKVLKGQQKQCKGFIFKYK